MHSRLLCHIVIQTHELNCRHRMHLLVLLLPILLPALLTCVHFSMSLGNFSTAVMHVSMASSRISAVMSVYLSRGYLACLKNVSMSIGCSVSAAIVLPSADAQAKPPA